MESAVMTAVAHHLNVYRLTNVLSLGKLNGKYIFYRLLATSNL